MLAAGATEQQAQQAAAAAQHQAMQAGAATANQAQIMAGAGQQQQMILDGQAAQQAAQFGQQATLAGMDYGSLGGANEAYQAGLSNQVAQSTAANSAAASNAATRSANKSNMFGNLVTLGLGIAGLPGVSDERLKENIIKTGKSPSGIPIYQFNYIGGSETYSGAMAQDLLNIKPEVVFVDDSGFYMVDYSGIDVDMKLIN
jgi:hypothetical protein